MPSFHGDQKYFVTIKQWWSLGWQPNFFSWQPTHLHHWMAIEIFWSLKGVNACVIILEKQLSFSLLGD
jgi:hypothetical protein